MPPSRTSFHSDDSRPLLPLPPGTPASLPPFHLPALDSLPPSQVHGKLNYFLRAYQREGVRFLWDRVGRGGGGILCDDMGLGKTVQVIAFLSALFEKEGVGEDKRRIRELRIGDRKVQPVLVICPSSVLCNWEEELNSWGHFSVVRFHKGDKEEALRMARKGSIEVVMTTFDTARQHKEELDMVDWRVMVVDECHKIKEISSGITRALKAFSCKIRIGLTGTALQNKYEELWCLLDWANPGCLGSAKHFQTEFTSPMTKGFRLDATKAELAAARKSQAKLNTLKQSWMIRRTKDGVISDQLPKKIDQVVFCGLSKFQMSVFNFLLSHPITKLVLTAWERCTCGKKLPRSRCCYRKSGPQPQALLFQLMHIFLKVANHAALLLPKSTNSVAQARLGEEICLAAAEKHPELRERNFLQLSNPRYSGKMEVLAGLLTVLEAENAKVLLFSYSTTLLDILEAYISSKGYTHCRLDGNTRTDVRQQMVKEFNTNQSIFIFLLSTKAGGLGLNITGANTVIIFDPNWNPSHDLQAQDRAYRLGQTKDVRVYRLVSAGCIEEIIYLRQLYKQQLAKASVDGCTAKRYFRAVQGDTRRKGELFGIKNLLRVTAPGARACLTEDIERRNREMEGKVRGKSKVELAIHEYELQEKVDNVGEDDPFNIGLEKEFGGGVVYAHVNQQVVGGSREEEHISNCAQRELEMGQGGQPAEECEMLNNTQAVVGAEAKQDTDKYNPGTAEDLVRVRETSDGRIVYGDTPAKQRMEVFLKMAGRLGMDQKELARSVLEKGWIERLEMLKDYGDEEGKALMEEARMAFEQEQKELLLRRVSYNNVGNKYRLGGKNRVSKQKRNSTNFQSTSGLASIGMKVAPQPTSVVPRPPSCPLFPADDDQLLIALDHHPPPLPSSATFSDDDDDDLIQLLQPSRVQPPPLTRPVKPAPPGQTYKRKRRVDSGEESTTDTLQNIFVSQEDVSQDDLRKKRRSDSSCVELASSHSEDTISDLFSYDKEASNLHRKMKASLECNSGFKKGSSSSLNLTENDLKKRRRKDSSCVEMVGTRSEDTISDIFSCDIGWWGEGRNLQRKKGSLESQSGVKKGSSSSLGGIFTDGRDCGEGRGSLGRGLDAVNKKPTASVETIDDIFG